jgi:RHS repeat-associated protein
VTGHTYDGRNRLATRTDPLGRVETFTYDFNGNLKTLTDRKGQVTTHTYDAQNRRIRSDFADGSFVAYEYDPTGRVLTATDSQTGSITNTFDPLSRLTAQITPQGAITYSYDPAGRRQSMQVNGLAPVQYGYDANSRLTQIVRGPQTATLGYDAADRRTTLTLPNGVTTSYSYDAASRLIAQTYTGPGGPLGSLTYAYDANGNRLATGGSFARTLIPSAIPTTSYDQANQQLAFGPTTQTFDTNGNLLTQTDASGTTTYTWDARNRLVGISSPSVTASFSYDALGRRVQKVINGQPIQFLYDRADVVQQADPLGTTSYLRSLDIDESFSFTNRDGTYFSIYDPLGSALAVLDPSATSMVEYAYDPFGRTASTNPTFPQDFQFTGRENDGIAGLYFYRTRYYSPALHRFLSEDPLGLLAGPHAYRYALNNPVSFRDPLGLDVTVTRY